MKIDFDITPFQEAVTGMIRKLEDARKQEMPSEFLNWQSEDLNRRQPRIDQQTDKTVTTYIRERRGSYKLQKVEGKKRRVTQRSRPILRPILFERLCIRMSDMLENKLTWR
jgi:hypothetical protein